MSDFFHFIHYLGKSNTFCSADPFKLKPMRSKMLVWAYHQRVSRLKNVAEKLKIRYGKNRTISVRVKGRLDPISQNNISKGQRQT